MKINMGCGFNKLAGYTNIDKYPACELDIQMDLEVFPWKLNTNEADEAIFNHSLEHMGATSEIFLNIIKELYRVCKPNARINIIVPHPRHDNFLNDPTHVRIITPEIFTLFSKKLNQHWKEIGTSNTPLGFYLDVDFEIKNVKQALEKKYLDQLTQKVISEEQLSEFVYEKNNVIVETHIELCVIK